MFITHMQIVYWLLHIDFYPRTYDVMYYVLTTRPLPALSRVEQNYFRTPLTHFSFPESVIEWHHVDGVLVPSVCTYHEATIESVGLWVLVQADWLIELGYQLRMIQQFDKITHGREVRDLIFTNNPDLVHSTITEECALFSNHMVVSVNVNYQLKKAPR